MSANVSFTSQRYWATVCRLVTETADVVTVYFAQPKGFKYLAGQYITVFFDDTDVPEGKAYSLSSCPADMEMSITVKKIGLFSGKIHDLKPGDKVAISQAYGMFNAFGDEPLVALVAGVGIAPAYSIIRHEVVNSTGRPVQLIYSSPTDESIVFRDDIARLKSWAPNLSARYVVTRQLDSPDYGPRIDARVVAREFTDRVIGICGTVDFVRDMRNQLIEAGMDEDRIVTEVFFEVAGR